MNGILLKLESCSCPPDQDQLFELHCACNHQGRSCANPNKNIAHNSILLDDIYGYKIYIRD